jgi:hypothetical protein
MMLSLMFGEFVVWFLLPRVCWWNVGSMGRFFFVESESFELIL